MRKNNGTKRNQETFGIDKNVSLIGINCELTMTLMRCTNIYIYVSKYTIKNIKKFSHTWEQILVKKTAISLFSYKLHPLRILVFYINDLI